MIAFDDYAQFGLIPYETLYYQDSQIHFPLEHYKRLKRACHVLKLPFDISFEKFIDELNQSIKKTQNSFGGLKVIYYNQNLIIIEKKIKYSKNLYEKGYYLKLSKASRSSKNILVYLKTFNVGLNYIEEKRAKSKGYDSCLFINQFGYISEAAFANIFFRRDETLFTPHISCGILNGVTRKKVIEWAQNQGYTIKKTFLTKEDISTMDECFITSSIAGVFPVKRIDQIEFHNIDFASKINKTKFFTRPWNTI